MTFNLETFCGNLTKLRLGQLRDIYSLKIPESLTIKKVHAEMDHLNLLHRFPLQEWSEANDAINRNGLYFIQVKDRYEVFSGERGGKHLPRTFVLKGDAFDWWLDKVFHELRHAAQDTLIK